MKEQMQPDPKLQPVKAGQPTPTPIPPDGMIPIGSSTFSYGSPDNIVTVAATGAPSQYEMANNPQAAVVVGLSTLSIDPPTGVSPQYAFGEQGTPDVAGLVGSCQDVGNQQHAAAMLKSANLATGNPAKVVFHWTDDTTSSAEFDSSTVATAVLTWIEQVRGAGMTLSDYCEVAVGYEPVADGSGWAWSQNDETTTVMLQLPAGSS